MRVTVVRPHDLGPTETNLRAKFQHASPVTLNPFSSFTFAQAIGSAAGLMLASLWWKSMERSKRSCPLNWVDGE